MGSSSVVLLQLGGHFRKSSVCHDWLMQDKAIPLPLQSHRQHGLADGVGREWLRFSAFELNGFFLHFSFRSEAWEFMALTEQGHLSAATGACSVFLFQLLYVLMRHLCFSLNLGCSCLLSHQLWHSCGDLWVTGAPGCLRGNSGCMCKRGIPDNITIVLIVSFLKIEICQIP